MQQEPKYMVLTNWIKDQVIKNNLRYGERFLSEKELSSRFELSRHTVRKAVGILEHEGFLERRRGSGTYVIYGQQKKRLPTKSIGIISTYLDSYIFPAIIRGMDAVLAENGYTMQLALTNNQVENETRALRMLLEKGVDGLIVEPTKSGLPNPNISLYHEIQDRGVPLIFFNAYYPDLQVPHICMDDHLAGKMAAQYLIDAGHRRIAGMFQADDRQGHLRYAGFMEALGEAGLEVHSTNVLWFTTDDINYLSEDIMRIKRGLGGCTALVCYNDQVAFKVIHALQGQGIQVPSGLSVTGIDNADLASICDPPITTFSHPMGKLGQAAAKNILRLIENPLFDATVDFTPELVERASVLPLKS